MTAPYRTKSARLRNRRSAQPTGHGRSRRPLRTVLAKVLCVCICCLSPLVSARAGAAGWAPAASVGEAYIYKTAIDGKSESATASAQIKSPTRSALSANELLDPTSNVWAGAQGLILRREQATTPLAANVIASAGDLSMAAASHPDGSISLFGAGNCTRLNMPKGDPAYALALAPEGGVLAAWAQGVGKLVFFDLNAPGCPASTMDTPLHGALNLTMSASGDVVAAQDQSGQVWLGRRGGSLRPVAKLSGAPAAIGFSGGEGVLLVLDAQGRGGAWNPRNGMLLRRAEVPGGPFARGTLHGLEACMWTADGKLVRWDMLQNRASAQAAGGLPEPAADSKSGWLELRGSELRIARPGLSWRALPTYDAKQPQLSASAQAGCLRLADVDGEVRYFDARTGRAQPQCFADDWKAVAISGDGTARIPGQTLRIFDQLGPGRGNSQVNARAISKDLVILWTAAAPELTVRIEAGVEGKSVLQKAAEALPESTTKTLSIPLRDGIAADAPTQRLELP